MKTITYHCEECKKEIYDNQFLEISAADSEIGFSVRNYFDGQVRHMSNWSEMHFCSQDCMVSMFFGRAKIICEPFIEVGIDYCSGTDHQVDVPAELITKSTAEAIEPIPKSSKGKGWPKGKPRGPRIAENLRKNKVETVEAISPAVDTPKTKGRKTTDNDVFYQKLEFAKSLGYESISAAIGEIDKYEFEKQFGKSQFSK